MRTIVEKMVLAAKLEKQKQAIFNLHCLFQAAKMLRNLEDHSASSEETNRILAGFRSINQGEQDA